MIDNHSHFPVLNYPLYLASMVVFITTSSHGRLNCVNLSELLVALCKVQHIMVLKYV